MRSLLVCFLLSAPAFAEDWRVLDGAGISAALSARVLQYEDGLTQNFFENGRTTFERGKGASWGRWWVKDSRYCEVPDGGDAVACYEVSIKGLEIQFTGPGYLRNTHIGRYVGL